MNENNKDENNYENYNDDDIWEDWDYTKYDVSCNYTEQRVLSVEEKKRMEDIEKENIALIEYLFEETNTTNLQHFPKLQPLPNKKLDLEKLRDEK